MKERYEGENRDQLIDALKRQNIVSHNHDLAEALANAGLLEEFKPGEDLIVQGATGGDNEIFLIIAGNLKIVVNGSERNTRGPGQHVGEMAAIEPSNPRSATVTAIDEVVALKIASSMFMKIGKSFGQIWLPIAQELAKRLYQRNRDIFVPNESPKIFIISSSESRHVAHAIRDGLEAKAYTKVWDQDVFFAGDYPLDNLEKEVNEADFAIAVAEPNDSTRSRKKTTKTMRDNVLFELGLFMGHLSRRRAILVHPRVRNLKVPSDMHGLTLITYQNGKKETIAKRVKPVCVTLNDLIKERGPYIFTAQGKP